MYKMAIVRKPGNSLVKGIHSVDLGEPDIKLALRQHAAYVAALRNCGLDVIVLDADESFPDSTFVEDTAILLSECAIITRPGALSRQGETKDMKAVLSSIYDEIVEINAPGMLEGGDVLKVGKHFYIGLSERTNQEGAEQLIEYLEQYGYTGSVVMFEGFLHLKTAVSYLENSMLLICEPLMELLDFESFTKLLVDGDEEYAANCIWVNDTILVPAGFRFPKTRQMLVDAGLSVLEVDVSEFRKLDGGLSCLSLRS